MSEQKKKPYIKKKKERVFYSSTSKKQLKQKRNPENELTGVYKQGNGPFGFVDTVNEESGEKKGYYVHESKKLDAFEGDEVAFETKSFRGKDEAIITKVIKRSENLVIGKLKIMNNFAFVVTSDPLITQDIFIPGKFIGGYTDGARVGVQIIKWDKKNPEGRIIESLESLPAGREDIYKIAFEMGARRSFPDAVKEQIKQFPKEIPNSEILKRKNLQSLLTYTIDGAESKDLDDAISIQETNTGYILSVHIADVAHYVTENSHLDREARKRGTSIYLVDQVIPMLPAEISNGLCSLHPGEDKLTLTCEMEVSNAGVVISSSVYESVIESDYRLTYREIDEITSGEMKLEDELQFGKKLNPELKDNIMLLKKFTDRLGKNTNQRGSLDFDFPETKIVLDDTGKPIEYKKYERYDSYKVIEECMVLANESVSKLYMKYPFLYRIHEKPDPEDVDKFVKLLDGKISEGEKSTDFSTLLVLLKENPRLFHMQKLLLRSLQKARYSEKNMGHFGLALKFYSHFTSPIRRYPDLQIHRIIKEIVSKDYTPTRREHYTEVLPKVARRSSDTADRAEKMEYRVRDMLACKYMSDKIGEAFTGNISGMIEKGFFIELPNTIEGFVPFGMTGLEFNLEKMCVMQIATGKEFHFGDEIQVRLSQVDMSKMRLEFELI
ncbi:ribonuclease R [Candidatus Gracilibacteria bacterium]|nr:ribonuclease R [Candidatus Gracilibacteria bacterium]